MARLYLNPEARIPNAVDISGTRLVPEAGAAVVDPSAAFQQDFYEQAVTNKLSDGSQVPVYVPTFNQLAAMLDAKPGWMLAPQLAVDPLENLGTEGGADSTLIGGPTLTATPLTTGTVAAELDGTNDTIRTPWETRTNYCTNACAVTNATGAADAGTTGDIRRTTELPEALLKALAEAGLEEITTGWKIDANGGADGGRVSFDTLTEGKTYTVSFYMYRTDATSAGNFRVRIENNAGTLIAGTEKLYSGAESIGKVIKHEVTFTAPVTEVYKIRWDETGAGPIQAYTTAVLCEKSAAPAKSFFPLLGQVARETAAFQGTAHNSICDYGPLARNSGLTIVGFMNKTTGSGNDGIVTTRQGTSVGVRLLGTATATGLAFRLNRASSAAAGTNSSTAWPGYDVGGMFAATFSDPLDRMAIGVNGVLPAYATGKTAQFEMPDEWGPLQFGAELTGTTNPLLGSILPVAIYPRELSAAEFASMYTGP